MSSHGPVVVVGVLILSFMVWLWSFSPHGPESEGEVVKWLNENKLGQLKDHPTIKRKCTQGAVQIVHIYSKVDSDSGAISTADRDSTLALHEP